MMVTGPSTWSICRAQLASRFFGETTEGVCERGAWRKGGTVQWHRVEGREASPRCALFHFFFSQRDRAHMRRHTGRQAITYGEGEGNVELPEGAVGQQHTEADAVGVLRGDGRRRNAGGKEDVDGVRLWQRRVRRKDAQPQPRIVAHPGGAKERQRGEG